MEEQSFELFINDQYQQYRSVPLYADDGSIPRILAVVENITGRKKIEEDLRKSEEQLRLVADNTSDSIAITTFDLKAKYIYVNPSVKTILGYEPEDLIGKSFFDFVHPDDKKSLFPLLKKYVNQKIKKLLIGGKNDEKTKTN